MWLPNPSPLACSSSGGGDTNLKPPEKSQHIQGQKVTGRCCVNVASGKNIPPSRGPLSHGLNG